MAAEKQNWQAYQDILSRLEPLDEEDIFRLMGKVQDACGYIPREILEDVSVRFGRPTTELYGAVTAYPGFRLSPPEGDQ